MPPEPVPPILHSQSALLGFDRPVIGPLSLEIPAGARWALTGPNGVGKSLLLKAITGQARVHGGRFELAPRTRPSLLAQDHARPQPWPLSGDDWLRAMGASVPEHEGVRALLNRRLDCLSGGQWQLLRLAAVLTSRGEDSSAQRLILLDEPANHLDAEVRADAVELIRAVPAETSMLITSHDDEFLQALGLENHPLAEYLDAG
ncbi:ABC transporter related protein [Thioalkalivibrio sp. K90mix]|uniref:ATP-binding cassette domain-containing protein n=1 Tax=unclassified Thioalkalivibrio TaxID=2621013 RepID=UPI00019591DB|nr:MULTISPECIES: ATP-binding cassette domain-containing protein [unclassified Thioalkalivibrio]ADC72926.1 ABC transporter related protein [Thioalkalivibrio sp. K90mix]